MSFVRQSMCRSCLSPYGRDTGPLRGDRTSCAIGQCLIEAMHHIAVCTPPRASPALCVSPRISVSHSGGECGECSTAHDIEVIERYHGRCLRRPGITEMKLMDKLSARESVGRMV